MALQRHLQNGADPESFWDKNRREPGSRHLIFGARFVLEHLGEGTPPNVSVLRRRIEAATDPQGKMRGFRAVDQTLFTGWYLSQIVYPPKRTYNALPKVRLSALTVDGQIVLPTKYLLPSRGDNHYISWLRAEGEEPFWVDDTTKVFGSVTAQQSLDPLRCLSPKRTPLEQEPKEIMIGLVRLANVASIVF